MTPRTSPFPRQRMAQAHVRGRRPRSPLPWYLIASPGPDAGAQILALRRPRWLRLILTVCSSCHQGPAAQRARADASPAKPPRTARPRPRPHALCPRCVRSVVKRAAYGGTAFARRAWPRGSCAMRPACAWSACGPSRGRAPAGWGKAAPSRYRPLSTRRRTLLLRLFLGSSYAHPRSCRCAQDRDSLGRGAPGPVPTPFLGRRSHRGRPPGVARPGNQWHLRRASSPLPSAPFRAVRDARRAVLCGPRFWIARDRRKGRAACRTSRGLSALVRCLQRGSVLGSVAVSLRVVCTLLRVLPQSWAARGLARLLLSSKRNGAARQAMRLGTVAPVASSTTRRRLDTMASVS